MNAPAKIQPLRRAMYEPQVKAFIPLVEGEELDLRCSMLMVRDQAAKGLTRCSPEAAGVLDQVQHLAGLYAFARMSLDCLRDFRAQLVRLLSCATGLEQVAFRIAHPDEGGDDASGR